MRGKKRILSDEDLAQMRASFASGGITRRTLADVYGISVSTVSLWLDPSMVDGKLRGKYRKSHGPHLNCPRCPRCESVTKDGQMCEWCRTDKARIGF
jgi:transposase